MRFGAAVLASAIVLSACGGSAAPADPTSAPATPIAAVATLPPAAATLPAAIAAPASASPKTASAPAAASGDPVLALGKTVFETAGDGQGCQACHGPQGKGGVLDNGQVTPNIQGASFQKVQDALRGGVPNMNFLKLTPAEVDAVVAYLDYLKSLP